MDFSGKYVLVTGGSRGIGRAVVQAFANHGAAAAINYNTNRQAAEETLGSLPGGPHFIVPADVTQPGSARQVIDTVSQKFGALDIVVNSAGVFSNTPWKMSILQCGKRPGMIRWRSTWWDRPMSATMQPGI